MKKNILNTSTFWIVFQFLLLLGLNIIGHVRAGNHFENPTLHNLIWVIYGFIGTIVGFPSGMYFFFYDTGTYANNLLLFYIIPVLYYPLFGLLVWYITTLKKYWRYAAIGLILFMLCSFIGCSTVIELPMQIT